MEVLIVEKDPLIRDQIKVGLQQFPDFHVTAGTGLAGLNEMRGRQFDCVFLGVDPQQKDTAKLLPHLRSFDTTTEVFVLTAARNVRDMAVDKSKYNIHSFVQTPIVVKELLGLVSRFVARRSEKQSAQPRKQGRNQPPAPAR